MACSLYDRTIRYIVLEISCSVSEVVWLNSFLVAISSEAIHIRVWKYTSIIFKRIARFQSRSGGRNTTCHYCRLNSGVLWSERLRQLSEWHRKWLQTDIELRVGEKLSIISTNQGFIPLISAGLHGEINERGDGKSISFQIVKRWYLGDKTAVCPAFVDGCRRSAEQLSVNNGACRGR